MLLPAPLKPCAESWVRFEPKQIIKRLNATPVFRNAAWPLFSSLFVTVERLVFGGVGAGNFCSSGVTVGIDSAKALRQGVWGFGHMVWPGFF